MPPVPALQQNIGGAMTLAPIKPIVMAIIVVIDLNILHPLVLLAPILLDCMTPRATSTSGHALSTRIDTMVKKIDVVVRKAAAFGRSAAVRGTTGRGACGQRTATGPSRDDRYDNVGLRLARL